VQTGMPLSTRKGLPGVVSAAFCLSLVFNLCPCNVAVEAATARETVTTSLKGLTGHTTQLVQQVQFYLQANNRWAPAPQGQDMQLCQALQSFQQAVGRISKDNRSQPVTTIQSEFSQLLSQSQNVEQLISSRAQSPLVSAAWLQIRSDLGSINQALYAVPYFNPANFYDSEAGFSPAMSGSTFQPALPGSNFNPINSGPPFHTGYYHPGHPFNHGWRPTNVNISENSTFDSDPEFRGSFSNFGTPGGMPGSYKAPDSSQVMSSLRNAGRETERFVSQLTGFLQGKGAWPPHPGTPEAQLCQNVERFQLQLRKLGSDTESNVSLPVLQAELKETAATSQNIDQLLMQMQANPEIIARWNEVRSRMNRTYQVFYSPGS
jgi:hypothetical protein